MSSWMTIPEWSDVRQVNVYHREQDKPQIEGERSDGLAKAKVEAPTRDIYRQDTSFIERSAIRLDSAEGENGQSEIAVKPENLHVLVRGTVQLPTDPDAQYEIWVSADDHYQLWVDGTYQGQGPISSNSECAFYDRYPIRGSETDISCDPVGQTICDVKPGTSAESNKPVGSQTVTIALHLYYHGRVSRSWNSADGRFCLWLSVRERMAWNAPEKDLAASELHLEKLYMEESCIEKSRQSGILMGNAHMDNTPSDEQWREVACADETWRYQICKAYSGKTVGYDTQFLENFDSRLWPDGWEQPEYCVDDIVQDGNVVEQPGCDIDIVRNRDDAGRSGHEDRQSLCGIEYSGDYMNQGAGDDTDHGVEDKEKVSDIGKKTWGYLVPALWAGYRMLPRSIQPLEEKKVFTSKQWKEVVSTTTTQVSSAKATVRLDVLPDGENHEPRSGHSVYRTDVQEMDENARENRECENGEHASRENDNGKSTADDVRLVLDFGREITGAIVAEAVGPAGAQVLIQCGEELAEDQARVETPLVRWDMRCGCAYQEVWTLGDGVNRLHPYDYKGFRYAQLTFPGTVELRQVYAWVRHYPMKEDACTLRCEDRELEQIFEICKNAVRCCSQDAYLDCPTREKGQYLGDALITARAQVWLTGSTELLRKCIGDFILSASISPSLMAVAPGSEMQEIADYSLLFPLLPMTDYEFTGDLNFLARCYPAVRKVTESFLIYQRKNGLLENVSALWNLVDWPENLRDHYDFPLTRPIVGEGCHNVINALWYGANKVQEDMERLLDLPVTGRCAQIAESFRNVFYRKEQGLFADSEVSAHCSIHANLYAAFFGLLPEEAEEPYVRMLRTPGRVCGALPCYFALESLAQMGRVQDCFDLMTRGDAYGWRNMVREGASASFEAWGKDQKWNTSLCHAWSSGFLPLFIEEIAGVHPDPKSPEGYRLEKPDVDCPAFELQVPWRGKKLRADFS